MNNHKLTNRIGCFMLLTAALVFIGFIVIDRKFPNMVTVAIYHGVEPLFWVICFGRNRISAIKGHRQMIFDRLLLHFEPMEGKA